MKNNPLAPFWSPLWHHKNPKGLKEDELKVIDKLQAKNDCENL